MPTRVWNTTEEAKPADGDAISGGAGQIRNLKVDLRERLEPDHEMADATSDPTGHNQISFVKDFDAEGMDSEPEVATGIKSYLFSRVAGLFFKRGTRVVNLAPERTTLTDEATISWDLETNPNAKVQLGGDRTLTSPTNPVTGDFYILRVEQDATGGRELTFNSIYTFEAAGIDNTIDAGAGKDTIFAFQYHDSKMQCIGKSKGL